MNTLPVVFPVYVACRGNSMLTPRALLIDMNSSKIHNT